MLFCKKRCSFKFPKIHKKTPKKRFWHRCFLVNSAKYPIIYFSKNTSDDCFIINFRYFYCPTYIQKRCHTCFPIEYFFGLICRLATRVSSIFHAVSQKSIFNQSSICDWVFLAKIVSNLNTLSIFEKKLHCDVRPGSKYDSKWETKIWETFVILANFVRWP